MLSYQADNASLSTQLGSFLRLAGLWVLRKRAEFVQATRQGINAVRPGFVLQYLPPPSSEKQEKPRLPRVGFTASRKVGGAVSRNRAKRRLRAIAQQGLPSIAQVGATYVLIARQRTLTRSFTQLEQDFSSALREVHRKSAGSKSSPEDRQSKTANRG